MTAHTSLPHDDDALVRAVHAASVPSLMLVLVHLTGDSALLRGTIKPRRASPQRPDGGLAPDEVASVRERALAALRAYRAGQAPGCPVPPSAPPHGPRGHARRRFR